jgi:hypothetical protein
LLILRSLLITTSSCVSTPPLVIVASLVIVATIVRLLLRSLRPILVLRLLIGTPGWQSIIRMRRLLISKAWRSSTIRRRRIGRSLLLGRVVTAIGWWWWVEGSSIGWGRHVMVGILIAVTHFCLKVVFAINNIIINLERTNKT